MMKQKAGAADTRALVNRPGATTDQPREEEPGKSVIELKLVAGKGIEPAVALSASERGALEACEGILERGLGTFFEVGNALLTIHESRLYRDTYATFKQYCEDRWNIGRSYAWRVMGAAERLKLLPSSDHLPKPANEFQMRPFLKLAPEEFPGAWKRAVKTAKEGKVTTQVVQAVIRELLPNNEKQAGKNGETSTLKGKWPKGQVLVLLNETKRQIQKGETEKAVAALEKIESLLFKA